MLIRMQEGILKSVTSLRYNIGCMHKWYGERKRGMQNRLSLPEIAGPERQQHTRNVLVIGENRKATEHGEVSST